MSFFSSYIVLQCKKLEQDIALYSEIKSTVNSRDVIIFGDFNNPTIDWNTFTGDQDGNRLVDLIEDISTPDS